MPTFIDPTCPKCKSLDTLHLGTSESSSSGYKQLFVCRVCEHKFSPLETFIPGVGPDAPIATSPNGSKQSASPYRLDLIPARSVLDVAAVLKHGADKYGENNWRGIPVRDHLNHALQHILAHLAGDTQDNHLGHATCRMMMAHEQQIVADESSSFPR